MWRIFSSQFANIRAALAFDSEFGFEGLRVEKKMRGFTSALGGGWLAIF